MAPRQKKRRRTLPRKEKEEVIYDTIIVRPRVPIAQAELQTSSSVSKAGQNAQSISPVKQSAPGQAEVQTSSGVSKGGEVALDTALAAQTALGQAEVQTSSGVSKGGEEALTTSLPTQPAPHRPQVLTVQEARRTVRATAAGGQQESGTIDSSVRSINTSRLLRQQVTFLHRSSMP